MILCSNPHAQYRSLRGEIDAAIGRVLPRICRAVAKVSGCDAYNLLQNNGALAHQAVFHVAKACHHGQIDSSDGAGGLRARAGQAIGSRRCRSLSTARGHQHWASSSS